jgi:hypothetical protein
MNHNPRISDSSLAVCGSKLAISTKFLGRRLQHLLINWHNFQTWVNIVLSHSLSMLTPSTQLLAVHDMTFLKENLLLVVKHTNGLPFLNLYNIYSIANITVECEYELPEWWSNYLANNVAPCKDLTPATLALFYPDPSARILCVTAKRATDAGPVHHKWLFINESHFKRSRRSGLTHVPWTQWALYANFPRPLPLMGHMPLVLDLSIWNPLPGPVSTPLVSFHMPTGKAARPGPGSDRKLSWLPYKAVENHAVMIPTVVFFFSVLIWITSTSVLPLRQAAFRHLRRGRAP